MMKDQEVKRKWVADLRSDKYTQGYGKLRVHIAGIDKFCCLGVLCDGLDPSQWVCDLDSDEYSYHSFYGFLPLDISAKLGLCNFEVKELVRMNDSKQYIFAQIAD